MHVQPAENLYVPERLEPYSKSSSILEDLLDDILFWARVSAWEFQNCQDVKFKLLGGAIMTIQVINSARSTKWLSTAQPNVMQYRIA